MAHLHLLLNHFPTIGMIIGLCVFLAGIALKSDDVKRVSLAVLFFIALVSLPTFATGTAAELALAGRPEVQKGLIEEHQNAAFLALVVMEIVGALAWLGLWQYRRLSRVPQFTTVAILAVGLASFGLMARAANLGGEIRHPEIQEQPVSAPTAEIPLARAIGAVMADQQWAWTASETLHFLGLCLLFGVVLVVDLRMLGFLQEIPYSTLHRLLPWAALGFGVNVATGMLFFIGAPATFYVTNSVFFWKLALILVAAANALYFTVFEQAWAVGAGGMPPMATRVAAGLGLFLWFGVIFCGQMLPFLGRSF